MRKLTGFSIFCSWIFFSENLKQSRNITPKNVPQLWTYLSATYGHWIVLETWNKIISFAREAVHYCLVKVNGVINVLPAVQYPCWYGLSVCFVCVYYSSYLSPPSSCGVSYDKGGLLSFQYLSESQDVVYCQECHIEMLEYASGSKDSTGINASPRICCWPPCPFSCYGFYRERRARDDKALAWRDSQHVNNWAALARVLWTLHIITTSTSTWANQTALMIAVIYLYVAFCLYCLTNYCTICIYFLLFLPCTRSPFIFASFLNDLRFFKSWW